MEDKQEVIAEVKERALSEGWSEEKLEKVIRKVLEKFDSDKEERLRKQKEKEALELEKERLRKEREELEKEKQELTKAKSSKKEDDTKEDVKKSKKNVFKKII